MASEGAFGQAMRMPEGPRRTAAVAAWIQSLYPTRPPILVGGAAVELYTGGAYTTGDFDFVGDVPAVVARSLEEAGFAREGRHWIHREGEIFIEFPGSSVAEHERVAMLEVGDVSVLTLSPEDMIVDRLAAWQFWKSTTDGASAFLIWKAQEKMLDRTRLKDIAKKRGVTGALTRLRDFADGIGSEKVGVEDLERWAEQTP